MSTRRVLRRGPVKLDDDDEVVHVSPPPRDATPELVKEGEEHAPTPTQQGWGSWLSSWASRTATGFDRMYELTSQPVALRDAPAPSHHGQGDDRKAAADTLDDLIRRAQQRPGREADAGREAATALDPEPGSNVWKPLDVASDTLSTYVQAGLKKLGPGKRDDHGADSPQAAKPASLQEQLKAIGRNTVSLASKARDHWQHQLGAVDDTIDMSVDDAFQSYQGGKCLESVRARGLAANKLVRAKQRSLTPKQHSSLAFKEVEEAFDSERLLESVIFLDASDFAGLFKLLALIDVFDDYEVVLAVAGKMISELQLFASKLDCRLLEDAQYCTHLVLDCVHHLLAPVKLAILSAKDKKDSFDMHDMASAIDDPPAQSDGDE